jgi:hypothetical protein
VKSTSSGTPLDPPLDPPLEPPPEVLGKKAPRLEFLDGVEAEVSKAIEQNSSQEKRPSISFKEDVEVDENNYGAPSSVRAGSTVL